MSIRRYSSRRERLGHVFLRDRLRRARTYDRIAGYFRSSIFELAHEELERIGQVRVVCNSDLDPRDLYAAQQASRDMALKEKWNEGASETDSVLHRARYQRLYQLLRRGNLEVRVVGRDHAPFLHGKAGVIESEDGKRTSFIGSLNETREGWSENYEILWEDDSPEAIQWVEEEFSYLWCQAIPLPRVILDEIERCAKRTEYPEIEACPPEAIGPAALCEAPLYRRGEALMPWQQAFVGMFLSHRDTYGSARLLLADEVGLGKTLSLAASAVLACLLGDGPTLILCPATLTEQWQVELLDKLGVPSAVWTNRKTWRDPSGHDIRTRGPEDILNCPYQIGIVSTGLVFQMTPEREHLLRRRYGTVLLDEAHRARRGSGAGRGAGEPNNLLRFMQDIAPRATHVLLGTATPIQTQVEELWDLLGILARGADHVLGRPGSPWQDARYAQDILTGRVSVKDEDEAWELLRNPLPPRSENHIFDYIRSDLGVPAREAFTARPPTDLEPITRELMDDELQTMREGMSFFQLNNPILRHTVLRRRAALEERGLLPRIGVDIHPTEDDHKPFFRGLGLLTSQPIDRAYEAASRFTDLLGRRTRAAGFMKNILLQRICSSLASGLATARRILAGQEVDEEEGEAPPTSSMTAAERQALGEVVEHLTGLTEDPKLQAVWHYLAESPGWLDHGCIIFSQFFDTARWVAESLARKLPKEPIALYAGADRSSLFRDGLSASVARDSIKKAVRDRSIRLVVATDAACEGLNLQALGTLINVDLPWNPSRLEQRLGRIKRIGQVRKTVDMLNLVYHGTRDEDVYARLSARMRDRYDIFGSLPDVIEDDWIDNIETLDRKLSEYIEKRRRVSAFELRYEGTVDPEGEPWERCSTVLSRRDIVDALSCAWTSAPRPGKAPRGEG